eukprot:8327431-Heterocapsa_arctica.AAC.1
MELSCSCAAPEYAASTASSSASALVATLGDQRALVVLLWGYGDIGIGGPCASSCSLFLLSCFLPFSFAFFFALAFAFSAFASSLSFAPFL